MADLFIASHEQAAYEIGERILASPTTARPPAPATAEQLRRAVVAAMTIHIALPPVSLDPNPDCPTCRGAGTYEVAEAGGPVHCHCRCPFCSGCNEPTCEGPCPTVEAIADAFGLLGDGGP